MHDPIFWTANYNTFLYAILALPIGLLIALALALLLNVEDSRAGDLPNIDLPAVSNPGRGIGHAVALAFQQQAGAGEFRACADSG